MVCFYHFIKKMSKYVWSWAVLNNSLMVFKLIFSFSNVKAIEKIEHQARVTHSYWIYGEGSLAQGQDRWAFHFHY